MNENRPLMPNLLDSFNCRNLVLTAPVLAFYFEYITSWQHALRKKAKVCTRKKCGSGIDKVKGSYIKCL